MGCCVLCAGALTDWDNQLFSWRELDYRYLRCADCGSLVCDPMPDAASVASLYGPDYATAFPDPYAISSSETVEWVRQQLSSWAPATFVDFGCGDGATLSMAARAGWRAVGVELDHAVAARTSTITGCPVRCQDQLGEISPAEVVHVADVLEHLPDPAAGLTQALELLGPGGTLLVQGPLEVGPTLFSLVIRPGRRRHARAVETPPYHLVQATSRGQQAFFRRCGLVEVSYTLSEVDWPAPSRLSRGDLTSARTVALYVLRQVSRRVDHLLGWRSSHLALGNRFHYVGRLPDRDDRHEAP